MLAQYSLSFFRVCAPFLQVGSWAAARLHLWLFVAFVFHCGLPRDIRHHSSPTPSSRQMEECSTTRESIRPSSSYNPTLSADKHAIQIGRFSPSPVADSLADGSGELQTSPLNGDARTAILSCRYGPHEKS